MNTAVEVAGLNPHSVYPAVLVVAAVTMKPDEAKLVADESRDEPVTWDTWTL